MKKKRGIKKEVRGKSEDTGSRKDENTEGG